VILERVVMKHVSMSDYQLLILLPGAVNIVRQPPTKPGLGRNGAGNRAGSSAWLCKR